MKINNILFLILTLFFSCTSKKEETPLLTEKTIAGNYETVSPYVVDQVISSPYPKETHGIWGNYTYFEDLVRYGSVSKSVEKMKFDTDIKIYYTEVLVLRPQFFEPTSFDTLKYEIVYSGSIDSLYLRSKVTGEKQLFIKMMNLPDTILTNLHESKYSAISMLEWKWFHGKYKLNEKNGNIREVVFNADGTVTGMEYDRYLFSIDVDGTDFISFLKDDEPVNFLLIERQTNTSFNCYNVKNFEDWEYPLEKESFAFRLEKIN